MILRDLVDAAGVENCQCCWLAPKHGSKEPYFPALATTVQPRQYETGYRPLRGLAGEAISAVAMRLLRPRMVREACVTVERMIRSFQPRFLLAVLESPAAIQVALAVHQRTRIPLRSIVWDDVDLFCRQGMLDRWTRAWIELSFQKALQASESVAVICENMQNAYRLEHGVDSFVLRHGVRVTMTESTGDVCSRRDHYLIGFAGSNTAPDCLQSLVRALDQAGWRLNGREVVLRMLGARYLLDSRSPQRIEYFGWRSVTETRERLAECDLLYLPQSFAAESRRFSELSFPTKLSTYVAARRPIFLHGPDYASLAGFWQRFELGPQCQELAPDRVLESVGQALQRDSACESTWLNEIGRVHEQVLSQRQFEEGVRRLVG